MEECGALDYATHLYIRLGWADLEPKEGEYAWVYNDKFKRLIQGAKDRGLKLAFRVYYDNTDYTRTISPEYLKDAGAEGFESNTGFWSPYTDDPVFLAKLEKFIKAMAGNLFSIRTAQPQWGIMEFTSLLIGLLGLLMRKPGNTA